MNQTRNNLVFSFKIVQGDQKFLSGDQLGSYLHINLMQNDQIKQRSRQHNIFLTAIDIDDTETNKLKFNCNEYVNSVTGNETIKNMVIDINKNSINTNLIERDGGSTNHLIDICKYQRKENQLQDQYLRKLIHCNHSQLTDLTLINCIASNFMFGDVRQCGVLNIQATDLVSNNSNNDNDNGDSNDVHFKFIKILLNRDQCLNFKSNDINNMTIHLEEDVLDGVKGHLQNSLVLFQQQVENSMDEKQLQTYALCTVNLSFGKYEIENSNHINKNGINILLKLLAPIAAIERNHLIYELNSEVSSMVYDKLVLCIERDDKMDNTIIKYYKIGNVKMMFNYNDKAKSPFHANPKTKDIASFGDICMLYQSIVYW